MHMYSTPDTHGDRFTPLSLYYWIVLASNGDIILLSLRNMLRRSSNAQVDLSKTTCLKNSTLKSPRKIYQCKVTHKTQCHNFKDSNMDKVCEERCTASGVIIFILRVWSTNPVQMECVDGKSLLVYFSSFVRLSFIINYSFALEIWGNNPIL